MIGTEQGIFLQTLRIENCHLRMCSLRRNDVNLFHSFGFEDSAVVPDVLQRVQLRMMKIRVSEKGQEGNNLVKEEILKGL